MAFYTVTERLNTYLVSWLCMLEDLWEKLSIAFTTTCAGIHLSNFPDVTRMTGSQTLHKLEPHSTWGCVTSVINFQEVIGGISTCSVIIICIAVALRDHNWNQRSIVGVLIDIYVSILQGKNAISKSLQPKCTNKENSSIHFTKSQKEKSTGGLRSKYTVCWISP